MPRARAKAEPAIRYDLPRASTVRWVPNRRSQWATCDTATREIQVIERLAEFPAWVLDYVLVHELAHLVHPNHSARFWALVNRFPRAERARGFLIAKGTER